MQLIGVPRVLGTGTQNQPNGYTFDLSGNMTVESLPAPNSMTYDGENRMAAFSGSGGTAAYTYDGNGVRVVKSVTSGTTTVSIYSGSSVLAEYDNGAAPSVPSREYIYNPAGGETTGLLAMISGPATTYYHQDHLSVRLTTDGTIGSPTYGQVLSQEGHLPYGEPWYQSGTGNKWLFTSYNRDSESGLDYALARYYDSRTGTFCSADPLAGSPGDPQSWNRYPYGRNDPIDITDPSGKSWWSSLLIDIGIGIGVALLPEIAPEWFSAASTGSALFSSDGLYGGFSGTTIWASSSPAASASLWSTALLGGVEGAGLAAVTRKPPKPKTKNLNCQGKAQYSAVGPDQALGDGALHSDNPNRPSIDGGTQNTVAVKLGFLGLTRAQLRQFGTQISITPSDNGMIADSGGPSAGSFSVSDLGDRNIQNAPGVRFDLYRFSNQAQALQFGLRRYNTTIKLNNAPKNAHCPPGWSAGK